MELNTSSERAAAVAFTAIFWTLYFFETSEVRKRPNRSENRVPERIRVNSGQVSAS